MDEVNSCVDKYLKQHFQSFSKMHAWADPGGKIIEIMLCHILYANVFLY